MTSTAFEGIQTAKVNGTTLAYREEGEGEPVVFVHGTVSDMRVWDQQLPEVRRSYRAIAYSRRYARPNEDIEPGVDDQMLPHVADLVAFLREIGAAPAHLVGHSWGAFISLLTAIRHPGLVRTLVLEELPVFPLFMKTTPPGVGELLRLFVTRPRTGVALLRFVAGTISPATKALERGNDEEALQIFTVGVLGAEAIERLPEGSEQIGRDNISSLRAQLMDAGFPPLADEEVRSVGAPTLLLTGVHSPTALLRMTDRLEELLPNVARVEIPDASHAMQQENPHATNRAILEFLGRHHQRA